MPLQGATEESRRLLQLLSAEAERAAALLELLEQEQQVLVKGEAEAIRAISEQKQALIGALGEQLLLRDRFLAAHRLPAGREGTDRFVEQAADSRELGQCWQRMQRLATELRDRNEVNGGIVSLARRHVGQALDILTSHTEQNPTYGPAGQQTGRSPQSLAKV